MPTRHRFSAHLIPPKLVALCKKRRRLRLSTLAARNRPTIRLEGSNWTKPIPLPLTQIATRIEHWTAKASTSSDGA